MDMGLQSFVSGIYLRANPDFELVDFDQLDSSAQTSLAAVCADEEMAGVLRPSVPGLRPKAICQATARLFSTLAQPQNLCSGGALDTDDLARLVLDNVLQIQKPDGTFISGATAYPLLPHSSSAATCDDISYSALQYGARLGMNNPRDLATRLYCYNRRPLTQTWQNRWPDTEALRREITDSIPGLDQQWAAVPPDPNNPHWFVWRCRYHRTVSRSLTYKLYIAPQVEDLREAAHCAFPLLAVCGATSVKIGSSAIGVLRPDKFVAYFNNRTTLCMAADALVPRLNHLTAQPVAFTSRFDAQGILSWGIDPPYTTTKVPWEGQSWRAWVTTRLALALIEAQRYETFMPAWQYALERIRLDGVDPKTWNAEGVFA